MEVGKTGVRSCIQGPRNRIFRNGGRLRAGERFAASHFEHASVKDKI